jgi:hypothetical protein
VQVNETYQVDFKSMHIKATPCLLLVDRSGKIELVVFGKVPTRGEEEIVERLR